MNIKILICAFLSISMSALASELCEKYALISVSEKTIKPSDDYPKIIFKDGKFEHILKNANSLPRAIESDSKCSDEPFFIRKDGLVWIVAKKWFPPHDDYFIAALYSPIKKKILGEFKGRNSSKIRFSENKLTYEFQTPASDSCGGQLEIGGKKEDYVEKRLPIVYKIEFTKSKIQESVDLPETFKTSRYKPFFKSQKDFEKYFHLSNPVDSSKIRPWVYEVVQNSALKCILAVESSKRNCSSFELKNVLCLK